MQKDQTDLHWVFGVPAADSAQGVVRSHPSVAPAVVAVGTCRTLAVAGLQTAAAEVAQLLAVERESFSVGFVPVLAEQIAEAVALRIALAGIAVRESALL